MQDKLPALLRLSESEHSKARSSSQLPPLTNLISLPQPSLNGIAGYARQSPSSFATV